MYANSGMEFFARGAQSGNTLSFYDLENAREVADLAKATAWVTANQRE